MLTQQSKEKQKIEKLESGVKICEEAMRKAEKYERLKDNKDFTEYLEDLKVLSDLHDREIKMAETMLLDAPTTGYLKTEFDKQQYVSSREDWIRFIERHQIQKAECLKWVKEPDHIISFASMCRERLPLLKKELEDLTHEPVGTEGNGKS